MTTLSTFDEQKYARLLSKALPVKIRTEAEYDRMNAIIRELVDRDDDGLSILHGTRYVGSPAQ